MDAADTLESNREGHNPDSVDDITLRNVPMSLRPRFAGDGRLRLPAWVSILRISGVDGNASDVIGVHGRRGCDPFDRTAEGLLIAEAFARFDFARPRKAQQWYREHGVLDLARLFPEDSFAPHDWPPEGERFHDAMTDVLDQQRNVRWHLLALARLSAERDKPEPPRTGWEPHEGWDTAWAQPALHDPSGGVLWLGAASTFEAHITPLMQQYPRFEDVFKGGSPSEYNLDGVTPKQFTEQWWPRAHAAWQRITAQDIPVLWVPRDGWSDHWADYEIDDVPPHGRMPVGRISTDWHGLVELERRLLQPYVRMAAVHEVEIEHPGFDLEHEDGHLTYIWEGPLEVHERRWWRSLLAPVYLQLLEGLRRVTEGHSGAAFCRECGQPFLTLDARRSSFCNDRERFRFAQRERRKRLSEPRRSGPRGMPG
jgi:hypothetical protein